MNYARQVLPDAARGWMLLVIALANASAWFQLSSPDDQHAAEALWLVLRELLIDQRGYALFAVLLGYGIGMLSLGYCEQGYSAASVRNRLLRRSAALLVLGAAHSLLFPGDILGAYGLVTALLAALVVSRCSTVLLSTAAAAGVLLCVAAMLLLPGAGQPATGTADLSRLLSDPSQLLVFFAENISLWLLSSVFAAAFTMVLPMAVLGVLLSRTAVLRNPEDHQKTLSLFCAAGLSGVLGMALLDHSALLAVLTGAMTAAGMLGALGLAVSTGYRGKPASRLGAASLSGYLEQTVIFAGLSALLWLTGSSLSVLGAAVAGLLCWLTTVLIRQRRSLRWAEPALRMLRR